MLPCYNYLKLVLTYIPLISFAESDTAAPTYEGSFTVPENAVAGQWKISALYILDVYYNTINRFVDIPVFTIQTSDITKPQISQVGLSRQSYEPYDAIEVSALTLNLGKTDTLTSKLSPSDATNKNVIWVSSKPDVAKVDANGKVTAVSCGTAMITASTADGGKTATCTVTVPKPALRAVQLSYRIKDKVYNGRSHGITATPKIGAGRITAVYYNKSKSLPKNIGAYKVTVDTAEGSSFSAAKYLYLETFKILPTKTYIRKITPGTRQMKVYWKKVSASQKISRYQIRYRIKGTSKWKTKTCKASLSSTTIKN